MTSEGAYIKVSEHQKGEHQIKKQCEIMYDLWLEDLTIRQSDIRLFKNGVCMGMRVSDK